MPQLLRTITLFTLLATYSASLVYGQCGTLAISSVTTTPVSCNGGNDGTITVNTTGGTGPFTYSNGQSSSGSALVATQAFNSDVVTSNSTTTQFYSPVCNNGRYFDYSSSTGCPSGSAYFSSLSTIGYDGCFLRTPQRDASGLNAVTLKFDISNSYNSGRPLDKITFSIWINNGYRNTTIVPVTVNGVATNELTFSQSRTCSAVEVVFNISNAALIDKSDMFLYINSSCGYSTCGSYWVALDNIEVLQGGSASYQSSNTFTGLPAGNYTISVQDANGCTLTYGSNPVTISQPTALVANGGYINPTTIGGSNGTAWVTPIGGNPPYTFSWSSGTPVNAVGDTIAGLSAGTYAVTVTDANGCNATASVTLSNPSCALAITSVGKVNASCAGVNNGSFTIATTGANGAVQYSINGGGTWQASNSFTGLAAGNYTVQVRDAANCTASAIGNPQVITAPQVINLGFNTTPVSTLGGTDGAISVTPTGGNSPYSFLWSNGSTAFSISNLSAGQYCVTVTDVAGCTATGCDNVTQPTCSLAVSSVQTTNVSCNAGSNGSITVTTTGANGTVEYSINAGGTWQQGNTFSGLLAGSYTVQVRDAAGCTASAPANPYTITQPAAMSLNFAVTPATVNGGNDGIINLTVTNGTTPRSFQWSNGANTEDLNGLAAGQYCVTVTDALGCTVSGCGNITQPGCNIILATTIVNASQFGANDGSIDLTASGGASPYIFVWNTGSTTEDLTGLGAGTYCVTVTDASNCTATTCGTVIQPANACAGFAITNVSVVQPNCPGESGRITVSISGGQNPVLYSIDSGATFQNGVSLFNVSGGTYNVLVRDNAGCEEAYTNNPIVINTPQGINPVITQAGNTLYVNDLGMSYQWLFGGNTIANANDTSYTVIANGAYSVEVTDANGCTYESNTLYVSGVGINEVADVAWELWPNPAQSTVSYSINTSAGQLMVYGSDGRLVLSQTLTASKGSIDLSELAGGVYHIRFVGAEGQVVKRVVKY